MAWVLDPLSIATGGYVGAGPGAGDFCPTALAIGTDGYVRFDVAPTSRGGAGGLDTSKQERQERQERERRLRERTEESVLRNKRELDALFPRESLEELRETGKTKIGDTEIEAEIPAAPQSPISLLAPSLEEIEDRVDREIAELIRAQELEEFQIAMVQFKKERDEFEEGLAMFIMLAMDD